MTDTDNDTPGIANAHPGHAARLLEASHSASAHVGVLHVEQVPLAKEAKPEIVADLRTGSNEAREKSPRQI